MSVATAGPRNGVGHMTGPRVELVFVTPEMAAEWLARNTKNRTLSKSHAETLSTCLTRGEWSLNGETIKFAADGRLLDGQHRLTACMMAGCGFWTYVARGLAGEAFDTIDVNLRPRKVGDVLSVHGKPHANRAAACSRMLFRFGQTGQFFDGYADKGFSVTLCMDMLSRRPGIEDSVALCTNVGVFPSPSLLAALHYLFGCANADLASEMVSVMRDGSAVLERPFAVFREAVISRRLHTRSAGARHFAFMAIRAWNSELSGTWIKKVYYKPNEEFPQISGLNYERLCDYV